MSLSGLAWNDEFDAWECGVESLGFGVDLDCLIHTGDFDLLPSKAQHNAAYDVAGASDELAREIRWQLQDAYEDACDPDEDLDDVTDPVFEQVVVPKFRDDSNRFAFVFCDSDYPCDVDFVVLLKNGNDFRICERDFAEIEFDWDDSRLIERFHDIQR